MDSLEDFVTPDYVPEKKTEEDEAAEKLPKLFDYINDLSYRKENLAKRITDKTGKFPAEFVPFVALRAFGNFYDTVLFANEINIRFSELSPEIQYLFYLNALPKRRRYAKYYSTDKSYNEVISAIAKYFHTGCNDAKYNYHMLTKEQTEHIVSSVNGTQNRG